MLYVLPLYHKYIALHIPFFYRDKDDVGMNDVPTKENKSYSSHSIKNILPQSNSMTKICVEANLAYTGHSVKQTVGEIPEDKVYEPVDSTPYYE